MLVRHLPVPLPFSVCSGQGIYFFSSSTFLWFAFSFAKCITMSYLSWTAASRSLCFLFPPGISQASISPLHLFVKQRQKICLMQKSRDCPQRKPKSFWRIINFLDTVQRNVVVCVNMCYQEIKASNCISFLLADWNNWEKTQFNVFWGSHIPLVQALTRISGTTKYIPGDPLKILSHFQALDSWGWEERYYHY